MPWIVTRTELFAAIAVDPVLLRVIRGDGNVLRLDVVLRHARRADGLDHPPHLLGVRGQRLAGGRALRLDTDGEGRLVRDGRDRSSPVDGDPAARLRCSAGRVGPAHARKCDDRRSRDDESCNSDRFHDCSFRGSAQIRRRGRAPSHCARALPVRRLPLGARNPRSGPRSSTSRGTFPGPRSSTWTKTCRRRRARAGATRCPTWTHSQLSQKPPGSVTRCS